MNTDKRRAERNPDATRRKILDAAYQEIYRHGYQGTRLDDIVQATGLTKGALYHHFPNKQALGYAVVDEVISGFIAHLWREPLATTQDPLGKIIETIQHLETYTGKQIYTLGCPLNNLAQEMSPLDEGFRTRIDDVYQLWHDAVVTAFERARELGQIRSDIDPHETATFLMGALSGCIGIAKNAQSGEQLQLCSAGLVRYLESLRNDS